MKITTTNIMKTYPDPRIHTKGNSAPSATSNDGHSFDALIIQSNPRQIEEHTFAESVSRQLSSGITDTASVEKVQDLKNQVAEGKYQVDAYAIASRILLV